MGFGFRPCLGDISSMKIRFGGRPKLPRKQVRDQRVVTFLTGDERRLLEKIANDTSVSVSRACHDLIVRSMCQEDVLPRVGKPAQRTEK